MGQLRGAGFGLILRQWSVGAAFGGLGGGRERGSDWVWNPALLGRGSACVEDAGGCRTHRVQPVRCTGEKEIGAQALGHGLGQKERGQE